VATLPASNSFAGGTAGVAITAANSGGASGTAFDSLIGGGTGPPTYDATHPMHGTLSLMCNFTGTAGTSQLTWTGLNQAVLWCRFYILFAGFPDIACRHLEIMDSGPAQSCALVINTVGKLGWRGSANTAISSTTSTTILSPLTQYRVECAATPGAGTGTAEWRLFVGDSTTAIETNTQTGLAFTAGNFASVRWGADTGPTTYQFWLDDPAVDAIGYPGPTTIPYPAIQTWPGAPLGAHWYGTTWNPI
jgi:hypothetical protein